MSHPQMNELLLLLQELLGDDRIEKQPGVVVYDPMRKAYLEFRYWPDGDDKWIPVMRMHLATDSAAERSAAREMGLPEPETVELTMRFGPRAGTTISFLRYICPVTTAEQAAALGLRTLRHVHHSAADAVLEMAFVCDYPFPIPLAESHGDKALGE